MLPFLLSNDQGGGPRVVNVPPPARFRPLVGKPCNVYIGDNAFRGHSRRDMTEAQKAGLRYEDKIQAELFTHNTEYMISPTFHFVDDSGFRTIIPDGLFSFPDRVVIIEIKSQHMPEAWWQLEKLYRPVVMARRPLCPILCLEICRSYDPAMPFPAEFQLFSSLAEALTSPPLTTLGVLPWRL